MTRFEDKVVIITGGGGGLGLAAAERLAQEGAKLVLVDIKADALDQAEAHLQEKVEGVEILKVTADVTDESQVEAYVQATLDTWGKIDGFFNNSGIEGKQNMTEDYGSDEFAKVLAVNLNGVFYGMKHVLKVMSQQGYGFICNSASVGGITGVGHQSGYSASKHGVVGLTRNSAVEYGESGIRINAIAPGAIMTDMVRGSLLQMDPDNPEEAGKVFVQKNPTKRFGQPEEVASVVAFLLSEDAGFINGAIIPIDGGQSASY